MRRSWLSFGTISLGAALLVSGCATTASAKTEPVEDIYQLNLLGTSNAEGTLVLSAPKKTVIKVPAGASSLDVTLSVRQDLMTKGYNIICVIDRGDQGYSLLVKGKLSVSQDDSNMGGIGGSAGQVIQRREVIQSRIREYFKFIRDNNATGVKASASDSWQAEATKALGQSIELVNMGSPTVGCNTASVIVETTLSGGEHRQSEVQLVNDDNLRWKVSSVRDLAHWKAIR